MVERIFKSFSKYGLKLPIIFTRWKGRGLINRFKANKLSRLNVNIFSPYVNTKFASLYIKDENDIDRILNGGYFGLMTIINGKAMKDFYIPLIMWGIIFVITYIPFVYGKKEVV